MLAVKLRRKIKNISTKLTAHSLRQRVLQPVKTTAQKTLLFTSVFVMSMSALSVVPLNSLVHAAGAYQITGKVTDQSGSGIQNVSVAATAIGGTTPQFGPVSTLANGTYELYVDAGTYDFHFNPASGSGLNPVVRNSITISADQTINVQMSPAPPPAPVKHTFSGVVYTHDGLPLSNLAVDLGDASTTTNGGAPGAFTMEVTAGTYSNLSAYTGLWSLGFPNPPYPNYPYGVNISADTGAPSFDLTNSNITQDLRMPETTVLNVTVRDSNGNTVPEGRGVNVEGMGTDGARFAFVPDGPNAYKLNSMSAQGTTDANGVAHVVVFKNATFAAGKVCVSGVGGLVSSFCNTVSVNSDSNNPSITLTQPMPPTHTFSGRLLDANNNPVSGVSMSFGNGGIGGLDANGYFSITTNPGAYNLGIRAGGANGPIHIPGLPGYFELGSFDKIDITNNDVTSGLVLPATTVVTIITKNASGNIISNRPVSANGSLTNYKLLTNGNQQFNASSSGDATTGANGSAGIVVFANSSFAPGTICADFTVSPYRVCNTASLNAGTNGLEVVLTEPTPPPPPMYTFSGKLVDSNNQGLANVDISLGGKYGARTGADGSFTMNVDPGTYPLSVQAGNFVLGPINLPGLPGLFRLDGKNIDLTTGSVALTLQLPAAAAVAVTVKDINGDPISGANISASGNVATPLITGDTAIFSGPIVGKSTTTGTNGTGSITFIRGTTFQPGQICATVLLFSACNTVQLDTASGDLNLVFQQQPPAPVAPTNLVIPSPTQNPSLTWSSASSATSYNVYRDGTKISSTTNPAYNDNNAPEGTHTYKVTAVNGGGESGASNSVNVVVDRTIPELTYSVSPVPNGANWNNSEPVIVSFNCTDDRSGVATCTDPVTVPLGDGTYVVTGTAVDKAGNTNSINAFISVDATAPTIAETHTPANANASNWYNTDVTTTFTCTDDANVYQSGIASCSPAATLNADGANQSVSGTAVDNAGNTSTKTVTYNIDKTAPEIGASLSAAPINGWNNGPVTVTFNCTDATSGVDNCTQPVTLSEDGTYIVTGTAVDKAGNITEINVTVQIDSTLPTVTNAAFAVNPKLTTDATATLTAEVADPLFNSSASGLTSVEYYDPVQQAWLPMTVSGSTATATINTSETEYPAGTYTFQVRATDAAGNVSAPTSASLRIRNPNQPPVINQLSGGTITEGSAYNENGTYSDPESTSWTATVDYGDGSGAQALPLSGVNFALGHLYQDEGVYTVTVSITDDEDATTIATTTVTVTNAAASISPITTSGNLVLLGSTLTTSASFTDPGTTDTHTAVWDWGDGSTPSSGTITESNGSGSVTGTHLYSAQGVYTVTLTITDNDGAVSTQTFQYIAVYNKGRFAGGDNFNSPIGASIAAPWLSGVATFGISVDNNAQGQVSGSVMMDFDAGNIHLSSSTPTMLITTADDHATLRGTGSVNGVSGYTYLVTGFDGKATKTADMIRFQITDPNGQIIYDTQMNAADTDEPSTPLLNPGNGSKADNLVITYFKN